MLIINIKKTIDGQRKQNINSLKSNRVRERKRDRVGLINNSS